MNGRPKHAFRTGDRVTIWRATRPAIGSSHAAWFLERFLSSSTILVRKRGPSWASQRFLLGREVGTWILVVVWIGLPVAIVARAAWVLLR